MAIDINLERPSATNVAAQAESVRENLGAIASTPAPILGSSSLSVTSGLATDLEKLVAQVKGESENTRSDVAKLRISAVMTLLDALNVQFNATQKAAFEEIMKADAQLVSANNELSGLYAKYGIENGSQAMTLMDLKIQELDEAVKRAQEDGEDHRKQAEAARRQRDADAAELQRLNSSSEHNEAAIRAAKQRLEASERKLAAANALVNQDATTVAAAKSAYADAVKDKNRILQLKGEVASAASAEAKQIAVIGEKALSVAAAAIAARASAEDVSSGEVHDSESRDLRKEAEKLASDPMTIIREALDKLDAAVMQTIDGNSEVKA